MALIFLLTGLAWAGSGLAVSFLAGSVLAPLACARGDFVARRQAPGARHVDGAAVGSDEAGDVDGVGQRVLAQPVGAERMAVARAADIARGVAQAGDGGAERLARRRLQGLLHPGVQAHHHGAVEHGRRVHLDLAGARADALQQHRGRRAAGFMPDGLGDLDLGGDRRQQLHAFAQAGDDLGVGPDLGLRRLGLRCLRLGVRRGYRRLSRLGSGGRSAFLVFAPPPPAARVPG